MSKENKITLAVVGGLLAVVVVLIVLSSKAGQPPAGRYDAFARCLAAKSITMYGAESCSWCQKEKAAFGDSFRFVPYVECPADPQKCIDLKIEGTPTWIGPDDLRLVGYQGLEKLSQASGCPLL